MRERLDNKDRLISNPNTGISSKGLWNIYEYYNQENRKKWCQNR